jgi:hypothetical protein
MTRARDVATQGGLVLISSTTIGSAVSSVTVSNAFSATYTAYAIKIFGGVSSGNVAMYLRFGSTTANYQGALWYNSSYGGSFLTETATAQSQFNYAGYGTTTNLHSNLEVHYPFETVPTAIKSDYAINIGGPGFSYGRLNDTNSYTSFNLTLSSGTITGGTISVYGYKK